MAKISKDAFYAKELYAAHKNIENEEVMQEQGASQEHAEQISHIANIRHNVHKNHQALFFTEFAEHDELWEQVEELQKFVGIKVLIPDYAPLDTDIELYERGDIDYDALIDGLNVAEHDDVTDPDTHKDLASEYYSDKIEQLNKAVERELANIDAQYGTNWCPSGKSRALKE